MLIILYLITLNAYEDSDTDIIILHIINWYAIKLTY